jgi:hypothetical protein
MDSINRPLIANPVRSGLAVFHAQEIFSQRKYRRNYPFLLSAAFEAEKPGALQPLVAEAVNFFRRSKLG